MDIDEEELAEVERLTRWISVDDELPKKYDNYRVFINTPEYEYERSAIYSESHGGWIDNGAAKLRGVTHWMPLFKLPKPTGRT
jgi:hypothetical protein